MAKADAALPKHHKATASERYVVFASSLGTVFEWYDFFIFGALASVMGKHFFAAPGINETTAFIFALLAFASGFLVRPFGALLFGRLGDLVGRKHTFLVTLTLMGGATFAIGLLPTYATIGVAAPVILIAIRLIQGLAIGGEYGGAATYVAEHAPNDRRGLYTGWIQTTGGFGSILAFVVIAATGYALGDEAFTAWGWRLPFLGSIILLVISIRIRLSLDESPVFKAMKAEGKQSASPLMEAFGEWRNLKTVLVALFGFVMGSGVVTYTATFLPLFFLERVLHVDSATASLLNAAALLITTPFCVFFGWLSDRIGRKKVIYTGFILALLTWFPLYKGLTAAANPALAEAQRAAPVTVIADPEGCAAQFDPVGKAKFLSSCDIAKSELTRAGIPYENIAAAPGAVAAVTIGGATIASFEGETLGADELKAKRSAFAAALKRELAAAGYPEKADPARIDIPVTIAILIGTTLLLSITYGPGAAMMVEMFPARIRYSAMSLPYHIGNGWFGGLLPSITFAVIAATGDIYSGLWYPVIIVAVCLVVGLLLVPETRHNNID